MRPATRLFAAVQKAKYLEPGAPTGLAGLLTHASPRSTLLYVYTNTLEKLKFFPEHSVYRQSTEALTRHRLSVIESVKPAGLEEWQARVEKIIDGHPEAFRKIPVTTPSGEKTFNIVWKPQTLEGMKTQEWDDDYVPKKPFPEGPTGQTTPRFLASSPSPLSQSTRSRRLRTRSLPVCSRRLSRWRRARTSWWRPSPRARCKY
jgi:NADH dehydrogenase (ubiquinone) 1 alpha subcomplex subunit 5